MSTMMSEEDKNKLEVNRPKLMECINLEDGLLLAHLRSQGVITQEQESLINQAGLSTLKVREMLDILLKGDCHALDNFVTALKKTNHGALVKECFGTAAARGPDLALLVPEYNKALCLAQDEEARNKFLERLTKQSEMMSPKASLVRVVDELRIGRDLLRYLVRLAPDVCEQIGRLFVITRVRVFHGPCFKPVDFQYYKELFDACEDDQSRDVLIEALLNAEVIINYEDFRNEDDVKWLDFLQRLSTEQRAALLRKTHDLELRVNRDVATVSCTGDKNILEATEFVLAVVYMYGCSIVSDRLVIGNKNWNLYLPVRMLSQNISGVKQLNLSHCTLCEEIPGYMPGQNMVVALDRQQPSLINQHLNKIEFNSVKGMANLQHCQVITSRACQLVISFCETVKLADLKRCFPSVQDLEVTHTRVSSSDSSNIKKETTGAGWPSLLERVDELGHMVQSLHQSLELVVVNAMCPESSFKLTGIARESNTLLCDLSLLNHGAVPLGPVLETFSPYMQCRSLKVEDCALKLGEEDVICNVQHCQSLRKLEIVNALNPKIDLAQLLILCSRCVQLETVHVSGGGFVYEYAQVKSIPQMPELKMLKLSGVNFYKPDEALIYQGKQEIGPHLSKLCPSAEVVIENTRWVKTGKEDIGLYLRKPCP